MKDNINPSHYKSHPSGVECIQITEHMSFTLGNAMKYIWRADMKNGVEDLRKAVWYLEREIAKREPHTYEWPDNESRIEIVGTNGNEGLHYGSFDVKSEGE